IVLVSATDDRTLAGLRSQLAVLGGGTDDLEPADLLRGAGLVVVDVRRGGRDHRGPSRQGRLEGEDIGAGAVEDRERLRVGSEVVGHDLAEARGPGIAAVPGCVAYVGCDNRIDDLGVGSGPV